MSGRLLAALAVAAVAAVLAAIVFRAGDAGDARWLRVGKPVFPGLADRIDDAATLVVERGDRRMTMRRDGDVWRLAESDDYPVDPAAIGRALIGLADLAYAAPKTRRSELWFKLGLGAPEGGADAAAGDDSPARRVVLRDASGAVLADLVTGTEISILPGEPVSGVYFRLPGSPQAWLGRSSPTAGGDPGEWLRRGIVDIDADRPRRVAVRHPDGEELVVSRETPQAPFRLEGIPEGRRLQYESDAGLVGGFLRRLELEDARRAGEGDAELFAPGRTTVVQVETFDGLTGRVEIAEGEDGHWLRLVFAGENAAAEAEAVRLGARVGVWRYRVGGYEVAAVLRRMADMLAPADTATGTDTGTGTGTTADNSASANTGAGGGTGAASQGGDAGKGAGSGR